MRHLAVNRVQVEAYEGRRRSPRPCLTPPMTPAGPRSSLGSHHTGGAKDHGEHQPRRAGREPDPRPRAAPHAERHRRLQPPPRRQHAPQGWRDRRVDREAELLRHHRLGKPGRELRPVPRARAPGRDRRPPRVARVGGPGRNEAPGGRGDRRHRPVPRRPRRRGERGEPVRAGRRGRGSDADFGAAADDDIPF